VSARAAGARLRPGAPAGAGLARGAWIAGALLGLAALVEFGVSSLTLAAIGIKYDGPGGNFLHKLHPATWLALLAILAHVATRPRPLAYLAGAPARFPGAVYFAAMWAFMIVWAALVQRLPVTLLVDTFFVAFAFLILYSDSDEETRRLIRLALHLFLFVNACIGVVEFATQTRLTPIVIAGKPILHETRSTALMGHPLVNAGASGAYALMLSLGADRAIGPFLRLALIGAQAVALVCFGGRTAIALFVILSALGQLRALAALLMGARFDARFALLVALGLPLLTAATAGAVMSGSLDRFIERFTDDKGSAQARVVMFDLFDHFTLEDVLIGPDQERLLYVQRILGIEYGIENSWLGFVFQYGAIASVIFLSGFAALLWEFRRRVGPQGTLALVYLLLQLSAAAALSVKSTMFNQFAILLLAICAPDAGRPAARSLHERARLAPDRG
jgi:hypothetical protein